MSVEVREGLQLSGGELRWCCDADWLDFATTAEVEPIAGVVALLDWAAAAGVATALVTSAPRANMELVLARLGLAERFAVVVLGDELANSKPNPLPYITALRRLGVVAEEAVGFEDSPVGIRAVCGAEVLAVGLATTYSPADLRRAGADLVIADFHDAGLRRILDSYTH